MSSQLRVVERLARERQDAAARALAEAQSQLTSVNAQLQQIIGYQADYRAKARGEHPGSLAVVQLVDARRFLGEINAIVNAQEARVVQVQALVAQRQQAWSEAARYTQAIAKLAQQREATARRAAEKREQQQLDDLHGQGLYRDC